MLLNILLTFQIIVAVLLGITVLLQRSEGGALGMGGGPSGFMTARGQGDLLTRATWTLFAIFLLLCVGLTILQGHERAGASVAGREDIGRLNATDLAPRAATTAPDAAPAPGVPASELRGLPAAPTTTPGSAVDGALGGVAPAQTPPTK
ncbi:MAG: preprotein translocase subunit SecG [Caulobacter sp.]|nr:preprotein translocase subunit SecG [Caulobacter sp.]